ncbi:MAG: hypothetical protein AB8F95_00015 [Bacteroidia bacterium]
MVRCTIAKWTAGILFLLVASSCFAQEESEDDEFDHHCHFEGRSLTVGIGVPYAFEIGAPGVNVRMYYNAAERLCFGPEYSYFKNQDVEVIDFDFVGHYIFETKWLGIYPLFGVNYTVEKETHAMHEVHEALGLVFGAGVHRNFNKLTVFAEYSNVILGIEDQFVTMGIMYNFN